MKREHPSSTTSMSTPQNSFKLGQETHVSVSRLAQACKKASNLQSHEGQIKPSCSGTNKIEHHQALELQGSNHESRNDADATLQQSSAGLTSLLKEKTRTTNEAEGSMEDSGRERLKRHRVEVAGRVWIPEIWGQEELLKDWIDCSAFDASMRNSSIMSARAALVQEGRTATSRRLRIENSC